MTEIKVGDRVRLTGPDWAGYYDNAVGSIVTVSKVSVDGMIWAREVGSLGENGILYDGRNGFRAELVTDDAEDEHTVASFSSLEAPLSEGDLEDVRAAGEALGINVTYKGRHVEDLLREALTFEQKVQDILHGMADLLVEKNAAYGNSALDPVRIFSKADTTEQLYVRLDDKINRVKQGHEYPGDDTIRDIIGYCTLILIAREGDE